MSLRHWRPSSSHSTILCKTIALPQQAPLFHLTVLKGLSYGLVNKLQPALPTTLYSRPSSRPVQKAGEIHVFTLQQR